MMRGMYSAISGLEAHQTMLDVTANNLANVDTIGYKAQRTTFVDQLSENLSAATGPNGFNGGSNAKQVGLGVSVGSIDNLMGTAARSRPRATRWTSTSRAMASCRSATATRAPPLPTPTTCPARSTTPAPAT